MTDQEWIDLGCRAVACRGWRWLPGMLVYRPGGIWEWRCVSVAKWADSLGIRSSISPDAIPDLRDPATLGCLLALVREAWGTAHTRQANHINGPRAWECACNDGDGWSYFSAPTEAHALVAALENAPEPAR